MCFSALHACSYVCHVCEVPEKVRRGCQNSWNQIQRWLSVPIWVLEIKLMTSGRVPSVLSHQPSLLSQTLFRCTECQQHFFLVGMGQVNNKSSEEKSMKPEHLILVHSFCPCVNPDGDEFRDFFCPMEGELSQSCNISLTCKLQIGYLHHQ